MLSKRYKLEGLSVAPVKITWSEEVVRDEDAGDFYVKLTPHVDFEESLIERTKHTDIDSTTYTRSHYKPGKAGKVPPQILGAARRNQIAVAGRKIFAELMRDMQVDVQKKLDMQKRVARNKMTGQRWNKKV